MKLAEALILRADLQRRKEELKNRIQNNSMVQEGDSPSENPKDLLKELDICINDLVNIIKRINKTNNETKFGEELTLTDALAIRDGMLEKRIALSQIIDSGTIKSDRYSRSEVKFISTINVESLQKDADMISKKFRELDTKIQGLNWTVDLI